jgi:hypothetical protein
MCCPKTTCCQTTRCHESISERAPHSDSRTSHPHYSSTPNFRATE